MTRQDAEERALTDYTAARGTVIPAGWVYGYRGEDSVDVYCDPPVQVRVESAPDEDLRHWVDQWLDPYWNVELVTPDSRFDGVRGLWVFGPSYEAI